MGAHVTFVAGAASTGAALGQTATGIAVGGMLSTFLRLGEDICAARANQRRQIAEAAAAQGQQNPAAAQAPDAFEADDGSASPTQG